MAIKFLNSVAVDTDVLFVDTANERVGIGTASPSSRLDIRTNGVNDGLNLSTSQPVSFAKIFNGNSESFPVGNLQLGYGSNITAGIQALSNRMSLKGGYTTGGQISFLSASTEVMRMTSTGLGIGTTNPSEKLHVAGGGSGNIRLDAGGTYYGTNIQAISSAGLKIGNDDFSGYAFFNNAGNVGIGTTIPGQKLTVEDIIGIKRSGVAAVTTLQQTGSGLTLNAPSGYHPLVVKYNGAEQVRFTSAGNVGIGTTSPDAKLHVESTSATGANFILETTNAGGIPLLDLKGAHSAQLRYKDELNVIQGRIDFEDSGTFNFIDVPNNSSTLYLKTGGNVGIGTTSPDYKLDVAGTFRVKHANSAVAIQEYSSGATIWMDGVDGDFVGGDYFNISAYGATDLAFGHGAATKMTLKNTGNLGIGTTSPGAKLEVVVADDTFNDVNVLKLKRIWATGSGSDRAHGVSFTDNNSTLATIYADRTNSGANYNSDLLFATNTGASGTSLSTRMIIKHTGNVGIGTSFPDEMLHIENSLGANIILNSNTGAVNNGIYMSEGASSTPTQNGAYFYYDSSANAVKLDTGTSSLSTKLIVLRDSGNVGIGTTSPGEPLTVKTKTDAYFPGIKVEDYNSSMGLYIQNIEGQNSGIGTGRYYNSGSWRSDVTAPTTIRLDGGAIRFYAQSGVTADVNYTPTQRMNIAATGAIKFNAYDSTNNTGTPTYLLGTDSSGNIVKTNTVPGSGAGPYLPLAGGTMVGTTNHNDNVYSKWGTGDDLRIWHNGTNSYVFNYGGNLYLGTGDADKDTVFLGDDGSGGETTYFYLDGSLTNGTSILGATRFPDNSKIYMGTGGDLEIYHDGSNSHIKDNGTGDLIITADNDLTFKDGSGNTMANMNASNSVELMFGNSKKFETTSTGVTVTGLMQASTVGVTNIVTNKVVKFNGSILDDSNITDTGSLITLGSAVTATGTMTSPTFLGDLNGTINTVTTAVTKANATNDTTVATTAFVQNLIGTIPAGLVFQGTWNAATNTPTLTSGSGTTGHFYIVSTSGSTNLDGVTDWVTGDWAVFIEQGATDAWEKIDNSSVLDGAGTGQTVALWSGSGTSNTLTNSKLVQNTAGTLITAFTNSTGNTGNFITNSEGGVEVGLKVKSRVNRASLLVEDNDTGVYISAEGGLGSFGRTQGASTSNININGLGSVGIGTISPNAKLDIEGTGGELLRLKDTDGSYTALTLYNGATSTDSRNWGIYNNGYNYGDFNIVSSTTNTGNPDITNATRLTISKSGNVGIGTTSPGAKLNVAGDILINSGEYISWGTVGATSIEGSTASNKLQFRTNSSDRMIIDSAGNVGIGTTSPSAALEVVGGIKLSDNSPLTWATSNTRIFGQSGYMQLQVASGDVMRLTSAGDVGIGVTTPRAKLDVAGGVKVADDTDTAGANKVGTLRYRTSGNNSYVDMCMQTGASTYAWINVVQNNW